jgi:hypothetical protein
MTVLSIGRPPGNALVGDPAIRLGPQVAALLPLLDERP